MADTVVIGLGNTLLGDDGIGVRVAEEVRSRLSDNEKVEVYDVGTSGMAALHILAGKKKALLVDCARMGDQPGAMRVFRPSEATSEKTMPGISVHEGDLIALLDVSRRVGELPPDVLIFGIEPADTSPGTLLSPVLSQKLEEYVSAVLEELCYTSQCL